MPLKYNPDVFTHAERIAPKISNISDNTHNRVGDVLAAVFADEAIRSRFAGAQIRYVTMCGKVAQQVLLIMEENPEDISVLALGDVSLPEFAGDAISGLVEKSYDLHSKLTSPSEEGFSYDVTANGTEASRHAMIEYFSKYYGFDEIPGLYQKLVDQSTPTAGGMRAIDDIVSAVITNGVKMTDISDTKPQTRLISPDNSFATWNAIAKFRSANGLLAQLHTVPTKQEKGLHLSAEEVRKFYEEHPTGAEQTVDCWYITPVGNPSGTTISPEQLESTCVEIITHNPKAIIIFDIVYARTLTQEKAHALLHGIINSPAILDRIVFVESLSKTHGICGERVGAFFATNKSIYGGIQTLNMTFTAGNGRQKEAMFMAAADATDEEEDTISRLHEFWRDEKVGLYEHLIKSGKFENIFDENQQHIDENQLKEPGGLYLFLKLKPGISAQQVAQETGCLGVEAQMATGSYIRFSVGTLTEPTYSKKPAEQSWADALITRLKKSI